MAKPSPPFDFTPVTKLMMHAMGDHPVDASVQMLGDHVLFWCSGVVSSLRQAAWSLTYLQSRFPTQWRHFNQWHLAKKSTKSATMEPESILCLAQTEDVDEIKEAHETTEKDDYALPALDLVLGPHYRRKRIDDITKHMEEEEYRQFSKTREASFVATGTRKHFVRAIGLDESCDQPTKLFLGYLAWDRLGCVIEIALAGRGALRLGAQDAGLTVEELTRSIAMCDTLKLDRDTSTLKRPPSAIDEAPVRKKLMAEKA